MKSACLHTAAALAVFCCINASAAPYPTEEQFRTAIAAVAGLPKLEGLELKILDAGKEGLARPLLAAGLNVTSGVCLVFYNTRPEDGLIQFFSTIRQEDMPVLLSAMVVHEITHCIEQREAYIRKRFDKVLPPDFNQGNVTIQGYLSVVKSGALVTWSEALADIASVLYLKWAAPDQWVRLANGIAAMRRDLAWKWPEHDTSAWLHEVIAADIGVAANQSLFETAFQLRSQYHLAK